MATLSNQNPAFEGKFVHKIHHLKTLLKESFAWLMSLVKLLLHAAQNRDETKEAIAVWMAHYGAQHSQNLAVIDTRFMMQVPKGYVVFNRLEAAAYGSDIAMFLEEMRSWIRWNEKNSKGDGDTHFRDEQWTMYNSVAMWKNNHFPWLSVSTIRRILHEIEGFNLATSEPYGKCDGRRWWTVIVEAPPGNLKDENSKHIIKRLKNQIEALMFQLEKTVLQIEKPPRQIENSILQNDVESGIKIIQESSTFQDSETSTPSHRRSTRESKNAKTNQTKRNGGGKKRKQSTQEEFFSEMRKTLKAMIAEEFERRYPANDQSQPVKEKANARQAEAAPPPNSALPPPLEFLRGFWTGKSPQELNDLLQQYGEENLRLLVDYCQQQKDRRGKPRFENPPGYATYLLQTRGQDATLWSDLLKEMPRGYNNAAQGDAYEVSKDETAEVVASKRYVEKSVEEIEALLQGKELNVPSKSDNDIWTSILRHHPEFKVCTLRGHADKIWVFEKTTNATIPPGTSARLYATFQDYTGLDVQEVLTCEAGEGPMPPPILAPTPAMLDAWKIVAKDQAWSCDYRLVRFQAKTWWIDAYCMSSHTDQEQFFIHKLHRIAPDIAPEKIILQPTTSGAADKRQ